jgi:ubiquinone/menaquinone biosynthesis C-methylase UbiE
MGSRRSIRLGVAVWLMLLSPAWAQDSADANGSATKAQARPKAKAGARRGPGRRGRYMGRPIADVMSYLGADWLFRAERVAEEQPEKMLDSLGIEPGMVVADVGAGAGYNTLRLAKRVGETGKVLATDLQPQMLAMLKQNVRQAGVAKVVKPILCTQTDPKLPESAVDLILMVDVYHEASDPDSALEGWKKALKPGGRIVFVEYRAEDPSVPIKPEHKMSVAQVRKEAEPHGLVFVESKEFLPWQHIIIFKKPKAGAKGGTEKAGK